jgi:hypothetical protein
MFSRKKVNLKCIIFPLTNYYVCPMSVEKLDFNTVSPAGAHGKPRIEQIEIPLSKSGVSPRQSHQM